MNKVTQVVIDLGGEWPSDLTNNSSIKIGGAEVSWQDFVYERRRLIGIWAKRRLSATPEFSEWLKTYTEDSRTEWPKHNRMDPIGQNGNTGEHYDSPPSNKYHRQLKGVTVDVYDVLKAFNVTCPALQHLIKKALCCGLRGHKDQAQDLQDIIDSAMRAKQLSDE